MPMGQHYGWMNNMTGGGIWMAPWGWILILILIVIVIYALAGRRGQRAPQRSRESHMEEKPDAETPLEILKKRYARGEVSREDFEQMKNDLHI